jgi:hypothetical protein
MGWGDKLIVGVTIAKREPGEVSNQAEPLRQIACSEGLLGIM